MTVHNKTLWHLSLMMLMLALSPMVAADDDSDSDSDDDVNYYVSLGTSLSVGVQADAAGNSILTDEGYTDQLFDILRGEMPNLEHVRLGCPGETTDGMITGVGSICTYPEGSQLAEALKFLRENEDDVVLVTIDVGVNDILACVDGLTIDEACLAGAFGMIQTNLPFILSELQWAADEDTPIIGMNYYNTILAAWLLGPGGQMIAIESAELANLFNNGVLGAVYAAFGIPVADVAAAFRINDFATMVPFPPPFGSVPVNVALLCSWTFMCPANPATTRPNIHANATGYGVIAATFAALVPTEDDDDDSDSDSD